MDFIYFLGRFHVLALHLPIGIIYAVVLLEFLARKPRFAGLAAAANYLWGAAAVTAVITVAMGLMHASEGGFTGESLERHRIYGIVVALASIALWIFRVKSLDTYRTLQPVTGIIMVVLVAMTGHYGGNMTHGSTYLVEYAPAPLKRLAGMEVREKASSATDAEVTKFPLASQLTFLAGLFTIQSHNFGESVLQRILRSITTAEATVSNPTSKMEA